MLDVFEKFATDEQKELQGVEVPLGNGAKIRVARSDNANYTKALFAAYEEHEVDLSAEGPEADKLDTEILARVMAKHVLVGFSGISYKGEELPYSEENAYKLLLIKDFRKTVLRHAAKRENFLSVADKKALKNS